MTKSLASLQITARAKGKQIMKPGIIFRGKPLVLEDGSIDSTRPANKQLANEYDPRVTVYFQPKAWADSDVIRAWHVDFDRATEAAANGKPRAITLDNLSSQLPKTIGQRAKRKNGTKFVYTPANCTDLCAVIDGGIGAYIKMRMAKSFLEDSESSEKRMYEWSDGKVDAKERRVLYTK